MVKQCTRTAGYLRCSRSGCCKKLIRHESVKQREYIMSHFVILDFRWHFSNISFPRSILIHAFCLVKDSGLTGGQSAFTAFTLPLSVSPTNAAGGHLVSVMQDEHNELMISAEVQLLAILCLFCLYTWWLSVLHVLIHYICTMTFI